MLATARVVAVADGRGGTRLAELRGQPPLVLRRTGPPPGTGPAEVHLVGGAAGPLGGDRLRLEIEVGAGAALCLRTVAASLALPGADGAESRLDVVAAVAGGGALSWLPEPLIAAGGCRHASVAAVDVSAGGRLCWREELVCGRHGEEPGDARLSTTIRYAGRTLHRQDLAVGPSAPGWDGPAVLGGARAAGSILLVEPDWAADGPPRPAVCGAGAAMMPLTGPAVLATAVDADLRGVRARLDTLIAGGGVGRASASQGAFGGHHALTTPAILFAWGRNTDSQNNRPTGTSSTR
jgi:urease accessory protein